MPSLPPDKPKKTRKKKSKKEEEELPPEEEIGGLPDFPIIFQMNENDSKENMIMNKVLMARHRHQNISFSFEWRCGDLIKFLHACETMPTLSFDNFQIQLLHRQLLIILSLL